MEPSFTIGVEEEFLTVDPVSLELRPHGDRVLAAARPRLGPCVQAELNLAQIEIATPVSTRLDELGAELRRARTALVVAGHEQQVSIAATGTHPSADWTAQAITPVR